MTSDLTAFRSLVVDAVRANPVALVDDPDLLARLANPARDCTLEELGFDSLARMELSIWLQMEAGIEIAEADILEHPSVNALAAYLAARAK